SKRNIHEITPAQAFITSVTGFITCLLNGDGYPHPESMLGYKVNAITLEQKPRNLHSRRTESRKAK
ncbi:hypothetical protein L9F63_008007, partial [Diploptera punctata]